MSSAREKCGWLKKGRTGTEMGWQTRWCDESTRKYPTRPAVCSQHCKNLRCVHSHGGCRETLGSVAHKCLQTVLSFWVLLTGLPAKWYIHVNCSFSLTSLSVHAGYGKQQKKPQGMQHFMIMQTCSGVVIAKTSSLSANLHLLKKPRYPKCVVLCQEMLCQEHCYYLHRSD